MRRAICLVAVVLVAFCVRANGQSIAPNRPQTPVPPYPYAQREISYTNPSDGTRISGTLTIPAGGDRHPAVVLVPGSGGADRDGTAAGHKPFLVIADHLARHGVAVLRTDSRKPDKYFDSTCDDLAGEVLAGVAFLATQPDIDAKRIGVAGHSMGSVVALAAAARSTQVAFVVMLSGFVVSARELEQAQVAQTLRATGMADEEVRRQVRLSFAVLDRVQAGQDDAATEAELRAIVKERVPPGMQLSAAQLEGFARQEKMILRSKYYRSLQALDPRILVRQVKCPLLAINGSLDQAVVARENLSEIERASRETGNTQMTALEVYGLNHYLQRAKTGSPLEIAQLEETMAPAALDLLAHWIRARTGLE